MLQFKKPSDGATAMGHVKIGSMPDFKSHRAIIEHLYMTEDLSKEEVKDKMRQEFGFQAT